MNQADAAEEADRARDAEARLAGHGCRDCDGGSIFNYAGMEDRYVFCAARACWHLREHWCNYWREQP